MSEHAGVVFEKPASQIPVTRSGQLLLKVKIVLEVQTGHVGGEAQGFRGDLHYVGLPIVGWPLLQMRAGATI